MDKDRIKKSRKLAVRIKKLITQCDGIKSEAYRLIAKHLPSNTDDLAKFYNTRNICTSLLSGNLAHDKTIVNFNKAFKILEGVENE